MAPCQLQLGHLGAQSGPAVVAATMVFGGGSGAVGVLLTGGWRGTFA